MLVLYETPGGYALFKVAKEKKITGTAASEIYKEFLTPEKANSL